MPHRVSGEPVLILDFGHWTLDRPLFVAVVRRFVIYCGTQQAEKS